LRLASANRPLDCSRATALHRGRGAGHLAGCEPDPAGRGRSPGQSPGYESSAPGGRLTIRRGNRGSPRCRILTGRGVDADTRLDTPSITLLRV